MYQIDKEFNFCYGHRVWSQTLNSKYSVDNMCKCRHLHGHNGKIKIGLQSPSLERGMVTDFKHLNIIGKLINETFDHKFLIDIHDPLFKDITGMKFTDVKFTGHYGIFDPAEIDLAVSKLPPEMQNPAREKYEGFVITDFIPTSENLCKFFFDLAAKTLKNLPNVVVQYVDFWETEKSHCRYNCDCSTN